MGVEQGEGIGDWNDSVTKKEPMDSQDRPHPLSSTCLLFIEKKIGLLGLPEFSKNKFKERSMEIRKQKNSQERRNNNSLVIKVKEL